MKPQDIVFVHGVQWQRDMQLKGYSRPLQDLIRSQAPTTEFVFYEALWSDVIENKERILISSGETLVKLVKGEVLQALLDFLKVVGHFVGLDSLKNQDKIANSKLSEMMDDPGWLGRAISVTLDIVLYLSIYGDDIRSKVREYINKSDNPVLMGHSLGSVILFDILAEDARNNQLKCRDFLSAASPLGLFKPNEDIATLSTVNWVNLYDPADLVGFWNPLKKWGYTNPLDSRIKTHELPFYSHVKYWTCSSIADELVDMALTA
ncbi:MAG: hypothetical protein WC799_25005 [Desulfobacteraceae bacterium]|jgi:hypothetical protein